MLPTSSGSGARPVLPVIQKLAAHEQAEHGSCAGRGEFEQPVLIDEREWDRDHAGLDEADEFVHDRDAKRRGTLAPIMRFAMREAADPYSSAMKPSAVTRIRPRK